MSKEIPIENWMQCPLAPEAINLETELAIENWMYQPLEQVVTIEMDDELPIEMWMQDENYLSKRIRKANTYLELEIETSMHKIL